MYSRGAVLECGHVLAEQVSLGSRQLSPVLPGGIRSFEQRIVNVGDVLHVVDVDAVVEPHALHQVERDIGGRMTEVCRVIGRDATDVQADLLRRAG